MSWIAIAVGGALGSVAGRGVNHLVHMRWLTTRFPIGPFFMDSIWQWLHTPSMPHIGDREALR